MNLQPTILHHLSEWTHSGSSLRVRDVWVPPPQNLKKGSTGPTRETLGWAPYQLSPIRDLSALECAKQLYSRMGRRCQKHMYLQTSQAAAQDGCERQPGRQSSEVAPSCASTGAQTGTSQGHGRQAGDTQRAVPQGEPGTAIGTLSGSQTPHLPAVRPEAELGQRKPFRLHLPPSLQMSDPASFVGRRRQGQDPESPQPPLTGHPGYQEPFCSAACCMTEHMT